MRRTLLPPSVGAVLFRFEPCFAAPTMEAFTAFVVGWLLCQGRHTLSGGLMAARSFGLWPRHHSGFYRLLSRARWEVDELGGILFRLLLPFLPREIDAAVDDTLCHRSGPQLFGAGMHHDAARSTYGGSAGRQVFFAFGHNWVVLSVWAPYPWNPAKGLAVPVLFRLYRAKRRCPSADYRKRTELAAELVDRLLSFLPEGRTLNLSGDREYGCTTLLSRVGDRVRFTGALPMDAALYDPIVVRRAGRGRPRKKGARLATPRAMAAARPARWRRITVAMYGRDVEVQVLTFVATWFAVTGPRALRIVIARDPHGRLADRAFFSTTATDSAEDVLRRYARRWSLEVTFAAAKQRLGLEEPRNGWWRRPHGQRRPFQQAGPESRGSRGRKAAERTVPLIFITYGIVLVWYLAHGQPAEDVARARRARPWDTAKREPAYADMLGALRRELWTARISADLPRTALAAKIRYLLPALSTAA